METSKFFWLTCLSWETRTHIYSVHSMDGSGCPVCILSDSFRRLAGSNIIIAIIITIISYS